MYEDIFDAKNACEHLSGFNVAGRYLVVLYHQTSKVPYSPADPCDWPVYPSTADLASPHSPHSCC